VEVVGGGDLDDVDVVSQRVLEPGGRALRAQLGAGGELRLIRVDGDSPLHVLQPRVDLPVRPGHPTAPDERHLEHALYLPAMTAVPIRRPPRGRHLSDPVPARHAGDILEQ
jgi:hypothetical protein